MNSHVVPQELADCIIDALSLNSSSRDDRHGLASCTLVCRAWSYRASRHLLKHIDVLALRLKRFMMMASMSARYRAYTEELSILGSIEMSDHWNRLFAAIPRLSSLEIWSNSAEFSAEILDPTIARLRSLEKLSIHCAEGDALPFLLYTFLHVKNLSLRSIGGPRDWMNDISHHVLRTAPMTVGQLTLEMSGGNSGPLSFLHVLVRPASLTLTNLNAENVPAVSDFLQRARQDLVRVELVATSKNRVASTGNPQGPIMDLPGLAICDKLATVALDVTDIAWGLDLVRAVLLHIPETTKHLRITLVPGQWHDVLELLATCLGARSDKYSKLTQLELSCLRTEPVSAREVQQQLVEMQSEVERSLPLRYRNIANVGIDVRR